MDAVNAALDAKDYEKAVLLATEQLKVAPQSSRLLVKRSVANLRLKKASEALADAESAVRFAPDEAVRGDAQLRRAVALYQLDRVGQAKSVIKFAVKSKCTDKTLPIWQEKLAAASAQEEPVAEIPGAVASAAPAKSPIRKDWYQTSTTVNVSVFIRDAAPETAVQIGANTVEIPDYGFVLDLHSSVDPGKSTFEVTKYKIELTLVKATTGTWPQLAKTPDEPKPFEKPKASFEKKWDIEDDDEETESADPQAFFQQIYRDATPEAQRAMMKSFIESNGTTLSTNWDEVKKGKVETAPPQGMEAKKWG